MSDIDRTLRDILGSEPAGPKNLIEFVGGPFDGQVVQVPRFPEFFFVDKSAVEGKTRKTKPNDNTKAPTYWRKDECSPIENVVMGKVVTLQKYAYFGHYSPKQIREGVVRDVPDDDEGGDQWEEVPV